jgi:hypothetical protein
MFKFVLQNTFICCTYTKHASYKKEAKSFAKNILCQVLYKRTMYKQHTKIKYENINM